MICWSKSSVKEFNVHNAAPYKPKPRVSFGNYRFIAIDANARVPKFNCCGGGPHKEVKNQTNSAAIADQLCRSTISIQKCAKVTPSESPNARPVDTESIRRPNDVRDEISLVSPRRSINLPKNKIDENASEIIASGGKNLGIKSALKINQTLNQATIQGSTAVVGITNKLLYQQSPQNSPQKVCSLVDSFYDPAIDEDLQHCVSNFNGRKTNASESEVELKINNSSVESSMTEIDKYQYRGMRIGNKRNSTGELVNPQKYTLGMQKEAIYVVGSIATMGEQSLNYLIELFRGKLSQSRLAMAHSKGHVKLPLFGQGVTLSLNDAKRFFQALVDNEFLKQRTEKDGHLTQHIFLDITQKGKSFVSSKVRAMRQSQVALTINRESAQKNETDKKKTVTFDLSANKDSSACKE